MKTITKSFGIDCVVFWRLLVKLNQEAIVENIYRVLTRNRILLKADEMRIGKAKGLNYKSYHFRRMDLFIASLKHSIEKVFGGVVKQHDRVSCVLRLR